MKGLHDRKHLPCLDPRGQGDTPRLRLQSYRSSAATLTERKGESGGNHSGILVTHISTGRSQLQTYGKFNKMFAEYHHLLVGTILWAIEKEFLRHVGKFPQSYQARRRVVCRDCINRRQKGAAEVICIQRGCEHVEPEGSKSNLQCQYLDHLSLPSKGGTIET